MTEEKSIFDQPNQTYGQQPLPNATTVLVLGILSIVICFLGVVLGIIGLVLANKDLARYRNGSAYYSTQSLSNLKAGRVCAIIGLLLNSLLVLGYIALAFAIISNPGWLR